MDCRSTSRWRLVRNLARSFLIGWAALLSHGSVLAAGPPSKLAVGIAQIALEAPLAANKDKIAGFIRQAKARGCRVVVFPETSLLWPLGTPRADIDQAVDELRKEVDACDLYALIGGQYQRDGVEKPFERLLVIDPDGKIIQTYNKMWSDARFQNCPGMFEIDGVPCAAAICADRWIRSVEELPAAAGAMILFEISNNYDNEWLPELGWFWYVPRALRNETYVVFANTGGEDRGQLTPGHGHSAVIGPDGKFLGALDTSSDKFFVVELDLTKSTGHEALARRNHPLFKPFWDAGLAILDGKIVLAPPHKPLVSPQVELKIAAAQMACSANVAYNAARMVEMVGRAAANDADVVVFPELCLSGDQDDEIKTAGQTELVSAFRRLQQAAKESRITVAFGTPLQDKGKRQNCAMVIGPDGDLLTRYAQIVVDRPQLFTGGTSTRAMWFEIKGVPCVVTIGHDALWSEIAEMAAWRGAQVHLHLANDRAISPDAELRRKQLWVNLASFHTFTATVNAAAPAAGGSVIWDDYHRGANRKMGGQGPFSAVQVAKAGREETILYATQKVPATNPQYGILTGKTNSQMTPWYATGARVIYSEITPRQ